MRVIAGSLILAALSSSALASDADKAYEFRQGYWQVVKHEFGDVMAAMIQKKRPMDQERFQAAAARLAVLAPLAKETTPVGSESDESRALPKIWSDADGYAEKLSAFEQNVAALNQAVASGDQSAIAPAFKDVAGACKACHKAYRAD